MEIDDQGFSPGKYDQMDPKDGIADGAVQGFPGDGVVWTEGLLKPILTGRPVQKPGIYRTTVEEDYVPYIIPQDYGNRCDVHWFQLTRRGGTGDCKFSSDQLSISVPRNTPPITWTGLITLFS